MATSTITGLTAVAPANLTDAAVLPVDDAAANTRKATVAQLRTALKVWETIASTTLGAAAATIDFISIPATFTELQLEVMARGTNVSASVIMSARFNNDATAVYDFIRAGSALSESLAATGFTLGDIPANSGSANAFSTHQLEIPFYNTTTRLKTLRWRGGGDWGTAGSTRSMYDGLGKWRSTAAINRITLILSAGNFDVGSIATLRGR